MKKNILLLLISLFFFLSSRAETLKNYLGKEDIPKSARFIIENHFDNIEIESISYKKKERNYLVKFKDGKRILFNAIGDWLMIDCKNEQIPLLLVPSWIRNKVAKKYGPMTYAITMQKVKKKIIIKLSNQVEVELK